jgi:Tfp pilus assembly protein PilX
MTTAFLIQKNEKGSVIIAAIMILALLTVTTFMAMNTSDTEVQISGNALIYKKTFYTAEAGIEHAMKLLEGPFVIHNAPKVKTGARADWNFALDGSNVNPANDPNADSIGEYDPDYGGAVWVNKATIGGVTYTVSLWNNQDAGDFQNDTDGLVWIQSDAVHPRRSRVSIRVLVEGDTTGEGITGYTAQAGAGAGKNYNANDLNPITDFSRQL